MRYISVFSGVEAASVAWEDLPLEPVAFCEIDEFPSAVLKERYPDVPNLGDITKVDWTKYAGAVDLIVGGSPCQSFSIAGNREGLNGESGLMFEYIRAVREVRPRAFLWENVPGAFSSEGGEAFRQLLSEMDKLGYGLAWRVLDAQFFGVPQRRRRVFLVGSLGDMSCSEVLIEQEGLPWNLASSRAKREELTSRFEGSVGRSCIPISKRTPKTMVVRCGKPGGGKGPLIQDDVSGTLATSNVQTLFQPTYCLAGNTIGRKPENGGNGCGYQEELGYTLTALDRRAAVTPTRNTPSRYTVRKLTPVECERLQGFPDNWTKIPYKGKDAEDCPDGPRYKAMGNSMAVPCMRWIGERICKYIFKTTE